MVLNTFEAKDLSKILIPSVGNNGSLRRTRTLKKFSQKGPDGKAS
jgi:hypothetical protein